MLRKKKIVPKNVLESSIDFEDRAQLTDFNSTMKRVLMFNIEIMKKLEKQHLKKIKK